jgi:hypothetical protein
MVPNSNIKNIQIYKEIMDENNEMDESRYILIRDGHWIHKKGPLQASSHNISSKLCLYG